MHAWVARLYAISILVLTAATTAVADQRMFPWTYEYATMARGEAEIEHYLTFSAPSGGFAGQATTQHQIEVEVGMNDRYDVGIYQVFEQVPGSGLEYAGFKVRNRYRFAEKGRYPVDALVYLEIAEPADFKETEVEAKLILARDFGPFRVSLNPIFEAEKGRKWETEGGYSAGLAWTAHHLLSAGIECRGSDDAHYAGPVLAHGNASFWMTLGASFRYSGTDADGPKMALRLITGIGI